MSHHHDGSKFLIRFFPLSDLQLLTFGDSQVSIFNYESGDLLMSLDLMKSYGINLTTFSYSEVSEIY